VFLAVVGVVVLVDALQLSNNRTGVDPLGPKPVPVFVGSCYRAGGRAGDRGHKRQPRRGRGWRGRTSQPVDIDGAAAAGVFVANIILIDFSAG
jgi:hypothetical protein